MLKPFRFYPTGCKLPRVQGGRRGEELPNLSSVSNSSSMTILMDADNLGETIKTAMDGNMSFVFQVDVDLACEETFYVTDAKTGEVRVVC